MTPEREKVLRKWIAGQSKDAASLLAELDSLRARLGEVERERDADRSTWIEQAKQHAASMNAIYEDNRDVRRQLAEARAAAWEMRIALEKCVAQLHDQQAMPDAKSDAVYEAALRSDIGKRETV